jgi:AGZA family xanthine/uracil permease-like MFS transporter
MEKLFRLQENKTTVRRELAAGLTTFLTMSFILSVNPGMLGGIGKGMTPESVFTATVIAMAFATLLMAFTSNLPVALGPNMGLNAFFTYTVVFDMGYSWQAALTAVLIQGILTVVIALTGMRKVIMDAIPLNLKKAITVGIGFQVALIGLEKAGVTTGDMASLALGTITSPSALVTVIGLLITIALYSKHVRGAILIGIIATTIVGTPLGGAVFPEGFSPFSLPSAPIFFQLDFSPIYDWRFFIVVFTFLFVNIFDTAGSLIGVTAQAGLIKESGEEGEVPCVRQAFLTTGLGSVAAGIMGTSPVTVYVESVAGMGAGGRTGLTSLFTGLFLLLTLFLAPLFLLIPGFATAPAMVMVGLLLMWKVTEIDFTYATEAIPAFLTIIMMPFTYNIAEGIVYGLLSFILIKTLTGKAKYIPTATWILAVVFIIRFSIH